MANAATVQELLPFLASPRADVRALALEGLLPLTAADAPTAARNLLLAPALLKRLREIAMIDQPASAHAAVNALINLTNEASAQRDVGGDATFLRWVVEAIISGGGLADPFAMLLSNLTKLESVCAALVAMRMPAPAPLEGDGTAVGVLAEAFVRGVGRTSNPEPTLHYLASVLADVSITAGGRAALMRVAVDAAPGETCLLQRIAVYTEHPNTIRRGGVASAIKNCCFERSAHLDVASDERWDVLPRILLPLCGPEEFELDDLDSLPQECQLLGEDKRREADARIRLIHVEALLLLCSSATGRAELRRRNVYRVVQLLHKAERDAQIKEACERLVQFLQLDESDETRVDELDADDDDELTVQEV